MIISANKWMIAIGAYAAITIFFRTFGFADSEPSALEGLLDYDFGSLITANPFDLVGNFAGLGRNFFAAIGEVLAWDYAVFNEGNWSEVQIFLRLVSVVFVLAFFMEVVGFIRSLIPFV